MDIGAPILRDVTLRDALYSELLQKSTALEKALEEIKSVEELKDEFLTTLSHELKTPLVSLKGFLQLLRQGKASEEQGQNYLEICWRNLNKLETQINNLLDLARLSHSKEQYSLEPVDLASLGAHFGREPPSRGRRAQGEAGREPLAGASAPDHGQPRQTGATGGQLVGQRREVQQGER